MTSRETPVGVWRQDPEDALEVKTMGGRSRAQASRPAGASEGRYTMVDLAAIEYHSLHVSVSELGAYD